MPPSETTGALRSPARCPSTGGVPPEVQPVGPVLAGTLRGRLPRPSDLSVWEDIPILSPWEHQKRSGHSCDRLTSAPAPCCPLTFPPALRTIHHAGETRASARGPAVPLVVMRAVCTTELALVSWIRREPRLSNLSLTHTHTQFGALERASVSKNKCERREVN